MHVVVGIDHLSSFPLLVNKVCEGLQLCIDRKNFLITLHYNESLTETSSGNYELAREFLSKLSISFNVTDFPFTSNNKMLYSLRTLSGVSSELFIYHTDVDEFVDIPSFRQALVEVKSGVCNAVTAEWRERLSPSGLPSPITLNHQGLREQFPYECQVSAQYMPLRTTRKVVYYKADYRLVSGQHEVWCKLPRSYSNKVRTSLLGKRYSKDCMLHIRKRLDKATPAGVIFGLLPEATVPAVYCNTTVMLYHYKFVNGVVNSLRSRATYYKYLKLSWWNQSNSLLGNYFGDFNGINISNPNYKCILS